jgi:hypothetical protein
LTFKGQVERDCTEVFQNADEFADVKRVIYGEFDREIPIIIDRDIAKDRQVPSGDNAQGINKIDMTVYISRADIDIIPHKGKRIKIAARDYKILRVSLEMGEIVLELGEFVE